MCFQLSEGEKGAEIADEIKFRGHVQPQLVIKKKKREHKPIMKSQLQHAFQIFSINSEAKVYSVLLE